MRHTLRSARQSKRKTLRGGSVESVEQLIMETPIGNVNILNPASSFVVVTYWWGRENMIRNLQRPCPEDIIQMAKNSVAADFGREIGFPRNIVEEANRIAVKSQTQRLSRQEEKYFEDLKDTFNKWKDGILARPDMRDKVRAKIQEIEPGILEQPGSVTS